MPGVPSDRGCEACRNQKKKCDQSQPTCSRCKRLQVTCRGSGQQRYTFKEQKIRLQCTKKVAQRPVSTVGRLSKSPSNETTVVASAFVSMLEVTDPRYDLSCYGAFLKDIPRRLGTNEALDASVSALTSASSSLHTRQPSSGTLVAYVHALKTLRFCLDDPVKAKRVDTLCAIYMIMICQDWTGRQDDQQTCHGEAIASILNFAVFQNWQGAFEVQMLITLCVPVIIESIFNPRIQLNPWFWKLVETYCQPPKPAEGKGGENGEDTKKTSGGVVIRSLARIPNFIRNPEAHVFDIQCAYQQMQNDIRKLRQYLITMTIESISPGVLHVNSGRMSTTKYNHYQMAYGLLLALAMTLNSTLYAMRSCDVLLVEESASFCNEIMSIAEYAAQYRPLGAASVPMCLAAAWAATDDAYRRAELKKVLAEYQTDFVVANWMDGAIWLRSKLELLRLKSWISHLEHERCGKTAIATGGDSRELLENGGKCCVQ